MKRQRVKLKHHLLVQPIQKMLGKMLADRIDQYKIQLNNYDNYKPNLNEMEDFIINTLEITRLFRSFTNKRPTKKINQIYSNMKV